jgi:UDP-N-acetylmuramoyl-L-alanyl-D-glutamate--2,6-diaminopimelate ligase
MMAAVVAAMTLGELLGPAAGAHAGLTVTDLVSDSRQVTPGAAFIAVAGERSHGIDFAGDALAAGASIVLYEPPAQAGEPPEPNLAVPGLSARIGELGRRFYGGDRRPETLVGITGTNGKTTVAWLVAQSLTTLGERCGYLGTIGYGTPGQLKHQSLTTPDCLTLHRELAGLGTVSAALEVSSHAIGQDRIAGLEFDVAVFTNLSQDHLDWHRSMSAYFETKARLFVREDLKTAVVNRRDHYGEALLGRLLPATHGMSVAVDSDKPADIQTRYEGNGLAGLVLDVSGAYGQARIESALIGGFNAENLSLALGALIARGHSLDAAAQALAQAGAPPGRMEVFGTDRNQPWVIVDYAHTPDALERVLGVIAALKTGEVTCVFGCGGDRDRSKRAAMGQAAAAYADHIVLTDDNPRSEDPATIVADIRAGAAGHGDIRIEHSRERAIGDALAAASPGDIVLIAGKGHESEQLIGATSRPFDDRAVVSRLLGSAC